MRNVISYQEGRMDLIKTKRFMLRPMTENDINLDYVSWWNASDIQAGLTSVACHWGRTHAVRHVRQFNNRNNFHLGIFNKNRFLIGFFAIFLNFKSQIATCNIVVGNKQYWGKKVSDEVGLAVIDFIFSQPGIVKIKTETLGSNRSSIALQKRFGLLPEAILRQEKKGINGVREDLYLFGLLKTDWLQENS